MSQTGRLWGLIVGLCLGGFLGLQYCLWPAVLHVWPRRDMEIKHQRDEVSRQLNDALKAWGQAECRLLQAEGNDANVTSRGAWCGRAPSPDFHNFDQELADALIPIITGKSVASMGEGDGAYKGYLEKYTKFYDGFDGAPFHDEVSIGPRIDFLDLAAPQYGLSVYDWVISTWVAEHIPAEFEPTYISNLVRHAREGIILSWAVPGQVHPGHVNLRSTAFVRKRMILEGFAVDEERTVSLHGKDGIPWKKNLLVLHRVARMDADDA